jgi:N-acetyl-gamma-glutamyl-phosphate reductase
VYFLLKGTVLIRIGIIGATGYGGRELLRLLVNHPQAELCALPSSSVAGQPVGDVLPAFRKAISLDFCEFDAQMLADSCDVVFVGVPGKQSMAPVAALRASGVKVIDIGPDFRLKNTDEFKQYYKVDHEAAHLLTESVYGLIPYYREAIKTASLVAVPGCYPISVLLPLRPLLDAPLSDIPVVIDAVSGVSGAGKSLSEPLHFSEMNENMWAYKVGVHQHIPEIEQELSNKLKVQFTPHVAPLTRGMLSTITLRPRVSFDPTEYFRRYKDEPFVRVLGEGNLPTVKQVASSNYCDFGWVNDKRTGNLIMISAIDNLMGGTAGMAVQCMNLMFNLEEGMGIPKGGTAP